MVGWIGKQYEKKQMNGWMGRKKNRRMVGWIEKKWMDGQKKQIDGLMDKNRWMVGWIENQIYEKIDGWMDGKYRWMVGCIKKMDGWVEGRTKKQMDGWTDLNYYTK